MKTNDLLDKCGWDVECSSPFEIRHRETGSFATGLAAEIVEEYYHNNAVTTFGELAIGQCFYEADAVDGVYMVKTPLVTTGGKKFNCVTVNASPVEEISEYVSLKDDDDEVYLKE